MIVRILNKDELDKMVIEGEATYINGGFIHNSSSTSYIPEMLKYGDTIIDNFQQGRHVIIDSNYYWARWMVAELVHTDYIKCLEEDVIIPEYVKRNLL